MDYSESLFTEQNDDDFIILPSQVETEQESESETEWNRMIKKLPALQIPVDFNSRQEGSDEEKCASESHNTDVQNEVSAKDDSKQEEQSQHDIPSCQDVIMENDDTGNNDDDHTVCTPAQHIASLQMSQNPMLVPETIDDTVNEIPPSQDYGSTPIIIPSSPTQDDEDQSSQSSVHTYTRDVNNSPFTITDDTLEDNDIISSKPPRDISSDRTVTSMYNNPIVNTGRPLDCDNILSFDLNSVNTLTSQSQNHVKCKDNDPVKDDEEIQTIHDKDDSANIEQLPTISQSPDFLQPTLVDEDQPSNKINKTNDNIIEKHPLFDLDIDDDNENVTMKVKYLSAPVSSQILQGSSLGVQNDGHCSQNEVADSQDLALHLSLTGSQMSRSQLDSSAVAELMDSGKISSANKDRQDTNINDSVKDLINLDCDSVLPPTPEKSIEKNETQSKNIEAFEICVQSDESQKDGCVLVQNNNNNDKHAIMNFDEELDLETNSVSSSKSIESVQSDKSQKMSQVSGKNSKIDNDWKRARKRDRKVKAVDDHPLIEWKNENESDIQPNTNTDVSTNRFSDEFHLVIPKALSDTSTSVAMETNDTVSQYIMSTKPFCAEQVTNRVTSNNEDSLKLPITNDNNTTSHDQLNIEMIESDTEMSQDEFKLEKPQVDDYNMLDDSEVIVSDRTRKRLRKSRFILEDSDDDDDVPLFNDKQEKETTSQNLPDKSNDEPESLPDKSNDEPESLHDKSNDEPESLHDKSNDEPESLHDKSNDKPESLPDKSNDEPESLPDKSNDEPESLPDKSNDEPESLPDKSNDEPEIFVAYKLDNVVENNESTLTYDPVVAMDTEKNEINDENVDEEKPEETTRVRRKSAEQSTQTAESKDATETAIQTVENKLNSETACQTAAENELGTELTVTTGEDKPGDDTSAVNTDNKNAEFEAMSLMVAQKVAEYLQSGCSPRSRSSSTCTDTSDSNKTPSRKSEDTKSPKELHDVLKTYSNILRRKHRSRNKSGSDKNMPNSLHPNPENSSEMTKDDSIKRRLSTQSLPVENTENKMFTPKRQYSHIATSSDKRNLDKSTYRYSTDSYNIDKYFDECQKSKKKVSPDAASRSEKSARPDGLPVKSLSVTNDNTRVKQHNVNDSSTPLSPDLPDKLSGTDGIQITRIKSKIDNSVNAENKLLSTDDSKMKSRKKSSENKLCLLTSKSSIEQSDQNGEQVPKAKKSLYESYELYKGKRVPRRDKEDKEKQVPLSISGSFTSSTQAFNVSKESEIIQDDPYQFHGSQSQVNIDEVRDCTIRLQPSKSLQDDRITLSDETSIETATTIGSSPHLPSTSSQSNAGRDKSFPSQSSQTVLSNVYKDGGNNKMVTIVTETIERVYTEITVIRKVLDPKGNVLESSQEVQKLDPVTVKENTTKSYIPATSFDPELTLTSVDKPESSRSPQVMTSRSNDNKVKPEVEPRRSNLESKPVTDSPYQEQIVSSSHSTDNHVSIVTSDGSIGCRVIAKWKDDYFYPGSLKSSEDRYSKYQVLFDDGDTLMVKGCNILLIQRLNVGQSVMVLSEDGVFEFGIITKVNEEGYSVETDDGKSGMYTYSQVILSSDQASCIISDHGTQITLQHDESRQPVNYGDVSLENLIHAPRRSAKKITKEELSKNETPNDNSRSRKRKLDLTEPESMSSLKTVKSTQSPVNKRRKVMDNLVHGLQVSPVCINKSQSKTRTGMTKKQLGPLPSKKLFNNIYFMLTYVEKSKELLNEERKLLRDSSIDTSDDSAVDDDMSVHFDKEYLKSQIIAGGGTILENLDEKLVSNGNKRVVLLSSTYTRTLKYLQCLSFGVPCLSHMWIVDSCAQGKLLDDKSYILPAGISLEKRKILEWKKKRCIFQGIKAIVFSKDKQFVECWTQILTLGKCTVYKQLQYTDLHVIVTDDSCSCTIERRAKSEKIPLVSTEWVIQCLINGRLVSYTGHPRYKHDYTLI
ncbi:hypothetical protein ACF0H5_012802 [Mactra antiquata]